MSQITHTFECDRCGHTITTSSREAIQCPECGDVWFAFCQVCGKPLEDVYSRIDGDCCQGPFDALFAKWEEKERECEWEREERAQQGAPILASIHEEEMEEIWVDEDEYDLDDIIEID